MMRKTTAFDRFLAGAGRALASIAAAPGASRSAPVAIMDGSSPPVDDRERKLSGALMRVNHVGEVCAQALYEAQALSTRDPRLKRFFRAAAAEEGDHLAWTRERLDALGDRPSLLNPIWYGGSFALGLLAGRMGDRFSLGFLVETERQVERHLAGHLDRLPQSDVQSRAIVARMRAEESGHADDAEALGAVPMPGPVKTAMRFAAQVMTATAHRI